MRNFISVVEPEGDVRLPLVGLLVTTAPTTGPDVAGGGPLDETTTEGLLAQSGLSGEVVLDSDSRHSSSSLMESMADAQWAKNRKNSSIRGNKIALLWHKC